VAFLTLKGRNRKASSIANGAYIYRNALLSAIVKRLMPEGQPQLLESKRCFFVSRCFAAATSKLSCAIRSLSIPSGCVSMADRALHARAPLAGFALPGRFGAASGKPGLVIEERTDLALATGHRAAGKRAGA
jgi:hypothetical protein